VISESQTILFARGAILLPPKIWLIAGPAFVLSQDQTLQFNILSQSLLISQPIGLLQKNNNNRPARLYCSVFKDQK
ncbi:MAG: hypothetical protein SCH71_16035, partial [Desulfobulbaceae bacterium]|nr:hypothetical protein [Desulfobulbaceae bacterium]